MTQLTQNQVAILRAIKETKTNTNRISESTELSVNLVKHYLVEMEKEGFIRCSSYIAVDGCRDYSHCNLEPKGEVALENPDFLLKSNPEKINQTNIYSQTVTVGFLNSGDGTVENFSQNISQSQSEINRLINAIRQSAQTLPEEHRDEVFLALEDLESDLSQPDKLQPKRIKRRIAALWAIVCILSASIASIADFSNNVLELAHKLGFPIELNQ
jgi:predicted transcriptional regulator